MYLISPHHLTVQTYISQDPPSKHNPSNHIYLPPQPNTKEKESTRTTPLLLLPLTPILTHLRMAHIARILTMKEDLAQVFFFDVAAFEGVFEVVLRKSFSTCVSILFTFQCCLGEEAIEWEDGTVGFDQLVGAVVKAGGACFFLGHVDYG